MSRKSADIQKKIDALQVKLAEALAAEKNAITVDKLTAGKKITFKFGKGEAQATLAGSILGVVVPEAGAKGGTLVRILTGEGVNTRVVSVFVSAIVTVEGAEEAPEADAAA